MAIAHFVAGSGLLGDEEKENENEEQVKDIDGLQRKPKQYYQHEDEAAFEPDGLHELCQV